MTIWFYLWLLLSGALLYFLCWTLFILYRQKKAWKAFAAARGLRYNSKSFFASPDISGVIQGYTVSLFTGEHTTPDARSTRKLTAIEINLSSTVPFEAAVASGGMVELVKGLGLKEEILPVHANWNKSYIAASNARAGLEEYLTAPRLEALTSLMKVKNAWVILIFRNNVMLLRVDTPDPLDRPEVIDRTLQKMIDAAKVLELQPNEDKRLQIAQQKRAAAPVLVVKDEHLQNSGLQLEGDENKEE